jgi:hypothetical protein
MNEPIEEILQYRTEPWTPRMGGEETLYWVRGELWGCCVYEDPLGFHVTVATAPVKRFATLTEAQVYADAVIDTAFRNLVTLN